MADKKDFMDFIKDACEDSSRRQAFVNEVYKQGVVEQDLQNLLHGWGYNGVKVEDCSTILRVAQSQAHAAHEVEPLY